MVPLRQNAESPFHAQILKLLYFAPSGPGDSCPVLIWVPSQTGVEVTQQVKGTLVTRHVLQSLSQLEFKPSVMRLLLWRCWNVAHIAWWVALLLQRAKTSCP